MTIVKEKRYELVGNLSVQEEKDLVEFVRGSRTETNALLKLVDNKKELIGSIYRGLRYRKKDLFIGAVYKHWHTLSSWSYDKNISTGFAMQNYIPEECVEDVLAEMGFKNPSSPKISSKDWNKALDEFTHILLVWKQGKGLEVGKYVKHVNYSKEEEVIVKGISWVMTSIKQRLSKDGFVYYEIEVSEQLK